MSNDRQLRLLLVFLLLVDAVANELAGVLVVLAREGFGKDEHVLHARDWRLEEHLDSTSISKIVYADIARKLVQRRTEPDRAIRPSEIDQKTKKFLF